MDLENKPSLLNFVLRLKMEGQDINPDTIKEFENQMVSFWRSYFKDKMVKYLEEKLKKRIDLEIDAVADYFDRIDFNEEFLKQKNGK